MDLGQFERHFRSTFGAFVGSKIVVALSGGADSVALLHLLHRADLGLELIAAHIHHGVRGPEADNDAVFCEQLSSDLEIPFFVHRLPGLPPGPEGLESTWRRARYDALKTIASENGANAVATAHQRDDVAEGVLVQLLRGAGPRAMAGIGEILNGVIRPLLPWSHEDLCRWLRDHDRAWCEDSSNASTDHLRNRVRHQVLPFLERFSPAARRHLVHLARSLATNELYLASQLELHAEWIDPWHPEGGVRVNIIKNLDPALRTRWLHSQAQRVSIGRVTRRQCELLSLVLEGETRALTLAGRWVLRRAASTLWLEPPHSIPPFKLDLRAGQTTLLPIPGWKVSFVPRNTSAPLGPWRFSCTPGRRLTLRPAQPEDRFADGTRANALIRHFAPRHLRKSWPILCDDAKILWIPGVELDTGSDQGEWSVEVMRT